MAYLLIKQVKYDGDNFRYESPILNDGINVIEGPNGTGKSTFMNLIYYGLGGDVAEFNKKDKRQKKHTEIVSDTNNYVELTIKVKKKYTLTRHIGSNEILVADTTDEEFELYSINRRGGNKVFSDWLLGILKIDVVELFQGTTQYKINIKDLFRLIYHNQKLNPAKIYKNPDSENYITDSELLRKTIFQLLIGKTFSEYYKTLAKLKEVDRERKVAKDVLNEFTLVIKNLNIGREELNSTFLKEKLEKYIDQLDKLYKTRKSLKGNRPLSSDNNFSITKKLKLELVGLGDEIDAKEAGKRIKIRELIRFNKVRENVILEVTQIKKIIHAHESLQLFSMDTCPCCLNNVDRKENACICGSPIDESEYERFFYTNDEYIDILKSKQKTKKTIDIAIEAVRTEVKSLIKEIEELSKQYQQIKIDIKEKLLQIEAGLDINRLDEIDDKILDIKQEMIIIEQLIQQQEKQEKYQDKYDVLDKSYQRLLLKENELKAKANTDMFDKVSAFSKKYNDLMTKTLKNCNTAKIDNLDYMPVINNGEYREASSSVAIRLMYFLTLLSLSLANDEIRFPRLLLIDTPKTGGIDNHELDKALKHIDEEIVNYKNKTCQVILTTGLQTYPPSFGKYIFETLKDSKRLLVRKN